MKSIPLLSILLVFAVRVFGLTPEQQQVPREVDAPDPKLAKIVLLAGSVSNKPGQHEYFAGCATNRGYRAFSLRSVSR